MTAPSTLETAAAADVPTELTDGYHLVVDALKLNGVDTIYGVVGIPITDLARLAQAQGIRYIGFRHESAAGHAAAIAGYLTKKPGICLTVSAPGLPQRPGRAGERDHQLLPDDPDHRLQRPRTSSTSNRATTRRWTSSPPRGRFAKAAYRVNRAEDIGLGIARAIRTAVSGRPGGVYLDIPAAVLGEAIDAERRRPDR